jgi:copper(I)-binding protein
MLAIAFLVCSCAAPATRGVEVRGVWTRPAAQGGNGAVYFAISSTAADELVAVDSDVAETVEMHESRMSGDVMEMRQLQSVPLPAGEQVTFEPGGLHIMLVGLKQDLAIGDEFEITLHFRDYQDIQILVPVQDTPASGAIHLPKKHQAGTQLSAKG